MLQRWNAILSLVITALALATAPADGFEGIVRGRGVAVSRDQVAKLTGDKGGPDKMFDIPFEKLVSMKGTTGIASMDNTMYISGSLARVEFPAEPGAYGLINTDKDVTWIVLPSQKTYVEWTAADTKTLSAKLTALEAEMKKQIAKLPADKRKQVEEMMRQQGIRDPDGAPKAPPVAEPMYKTRKVNGIQATGYQVRADGRTTIGWVTEDYPDLARMYQLTQERMQQMMPPLWRERQAAFQALAAHGLPVMVQVLDGQDYMANEVTAIEQKAVAKDMLTVPTGFTKTSGAEAMNGIDK